MPRRTPAGGPTSICTWSPGDRTSADRSDPNVGIASSPTFAQELGCRRFLGFKRIVEGAATGRCIVPIVVVAATVASLAAQATEPPTKPAASAPANAPKSPGAGPVFVGETVKGTFEVETYPNEAPKTVDHVVGRIKRN